MAQRPLLGFTPARIAVLLLTATLFACSPDATPITGGDAGVDSVEDTADAAEAFVIPSFDPKLTASAMTGNVGVTIDFTFDPNSDTDIKEFFYTWDFGDGDVIEVNPDERIDLVTKMSHTFKYKGLFPTRVTMTWRKNLKLAKTVVVEIEVVQPAELSLSTIALIGPTDVGPGDTIALTFDLQNDGAAVAVPFKVSILLSKDDSIDDKDLVIDTIDLDGMDSGLQGTVVVSYPENKPHVATIPAGAADGDYFVLVAADHGAVVPEINRLDNVGYATSLIHVDSTVVFPPDLVITAPTFDGTPAYNVGETATYQLDLKNAGSGEAKNFKFAVYLSKDAKLDVNPAAKKYEGDINVHDVLVTDSANSTVKTLAGETELPVFRGLSVPDLPDGTYFMIASIDTENNVAESDETNNTAVSASTLTVKKVIAQGFDLALLSMEVKPKGTYLGGTIGVAWHVKNTGTMPTPEFAATVYFCPTPSLSKTQCVINQTSFKIPALAVGQEQKSITSILVNTKTPVQDWYLFMLVDPDNKVPELDEGNNVQKWDTPPLKVSASALVELAVGNVGFHPASVVAGNAIKVSHKITNTGTTGSGATTTVYVLSTVPEINLANISNGKNVVIKSVTDSGVEGIDSAQRAETIVVPEGIDHNLSEFYVGVFLDATNVEKTDGKANNGSSAITKIKVLDAKGGCYDDPYDGKDSNNNATDSATKLKPGVYEKLGSCGNDDWYAVELSKGDSLVVKLFASEILWTVPVAADLDLEVMAPSGSKLDSQKGLSLAKQAVALTVKETGAYKIRVSPHSLGVLAHYTLDVQVTPPPAGIDLFASQLSVAPAAAYPGGLVKIKLSLTNLGSTPAGAFSLRFVLSEDAKIEVTDVALKQVVVADGLGAAATVELNESIVLPLVKGGKYNVGVLVDVKNDVKETNEANNATPSNTLTLNSQISCATDAFSGNHTVETASPLEAKSATYEKLNICPGLEDWFKIELPKGKAFSVKVNWVQKAGAGLVGLQLVDSTGKGVIAGTANPFDPVATIPYLQVAGTYYLHTYVLPLGGTTAEPYDYGLELTISDPDPTDVCLADVYESNNAAESAVELGCGIATMTLCIGDEDWFYLDLAKDESVKIEFAHEGSGFEFALYGSTTLPPLQKLSGPGIIDFKAPSTGTYYMRAFYKIAGKKGSGSFTYQLKVDGGKGIDLLPTILSIFPGSVVQGEDAYLTSKLSNECKDNAPSFHYGWYFSTDDTLDPSDPLMLEKKVAGLDAKSSAELDDKVPMPVDAVPGPAWLFLKIDNKDEVQESQELNNTASKSLTVVKLCLSDALEPNNTPTLAKPLEIGTVDSLSLCPFELDWYTVEVQKDETVTITANFDQALGDLDLRLYKPGKFGSALASSATKSTPEQIVYKATEGGKLYLRVGGFAGDSNAYSLSVCHSMAGKCLDCPSDLYCPEGAFCAEGGVCKVLGCTVGDDASCDDANQCTSEKCVSGKGCEFTSGADGVFCSDGDACTLGESCNGAGVCKAPLFTTLQTSFAQVGGRGGDMLVLGADATVYVGSVAGAGGVRSGAIERVDTFKTTWSAKIDMPGYAVAHLSAAVTRVDAGEVVAVGYVGPPSEVTPTLPTSVTATMPIFARVNGKNGAVLAKTMFTTAGKPQNGGALMDVVQAGTGFVAVGTYSAASAANGMDAWVVGINNSGVKTWEILIGDAGDDSFNSIVALPGGGWLVVGYDDIGGGKRLGLVAAIAADGKLGWSKAYGAPASYAALYGVALDNTARAIAVGGSDEKAVGGAAKLLPWVLTLTGATASKAPATAASSVIALSGGDGRGWLTSVFGLASGVLVGGTATAAAPSLGLDGLVWKLDDAGAVTLAYAVGSADEGSDDVLAKVGLWHDATRGFGTANALSTTQSSWFEMSVQPPKASCNDGNACTVDACAAKVGCTHTSVADGTACGGSAKCQSGICK